MTDRKLMQQTLEALELGYDSAKAEADQFHAAMAGYKPQRHAQMNADVQQIVAAITAQRERLTQPEQEPVAVPVAFITNGGKGELWWSRSVDKNGNTNMGDIPLYTTPPRRDWVGLTDEEILRVKGQFSGTLDVQFVDYARAIEAKLKEKNNGQ